MAHPEQLILLLYCTRGNQGLMSENKSESSNPLANTTFLRNIHDTLTNM